MNQWFSCYWLKVIGYRNWDWVPFGDQCIDCFSYLIDVKIGLPGALMKLIESLSLSPCVCSTDAVVGGKGRERRWKCATESLSQRMRRTARNTATVQVCVCPILMILVLTRVCVCVCNSCVMFSLPAIMFSKGKGEVHYKERWQMIPTSAADLRRTFVRLLDFIHLYHPPPLMLERVERSLIHCCWH